MIKSGRPYTNENESIDDSLLNALSDEEIIAIGEWLKKNIRPATYVCERTSYGLKHELERDTSIYMTNNQFKDAMLLVGYRPIEPSALNWKWRIEYIPDTIYNPSPFVKWAKDRRVHASDRDRDFIKDMANDKEFPVFAEHQIILDYLERCGAIDAAKQSFEDLWAKYEREDA